MNLEQIVEMADKAALYDTGLDQWVVPSSEILMRFAQLVAEAEREECAKCVEKQPSFEPYIESWGEGTETAFMETVEQGVWIMQEECAAAIRALGERT